MEILWLTSFHFNVIRKSKGTFLSMNVKFQSLLIHFQLPLFIKKSYDSHSSRICLFWSQHPLLHAFIVIWKNSIWENKRFIIVWLPFFVDF